eukprot:m.142625 g.142625  ORF g.142625 m.142625 type:complete len:93 (+) comp9651_c0_seq2:3228-3506(+)
MSIQVPQALVYVGLLGGVSWVVPFVAAALFFNEQGQLMIPEPLFKSIMVVVFGGLGSWLLLKALRRTGLTPKRGLLVGTLIRLLTDNRRRLR